MAWKQENDLFLWTPAHVPAAGSQGGDLLGATRPSLWPLSRCHGMIAEIQEVQMTPEEIEKLPYRPCVGVMLLNAAGEAFVGQRIDRNYDAWQMPQGGVDKGEAPRDAALRELWEETGVTADLVEVVAESDQWLPYELPHDLVAKLWKGRFRGQEQKWFLMRFDGRDDQVNIETEHQEFAKWRWMAVADLVDNIVPFKRSVYEAVLKEFEAHL